MSHLSSFLPSSPFWLALVTREKFKIVIFLIHYFCLKKHSYYYKFILGKFKKCLLKVKLNKISFSERNRLKIVFRTVLVSCGCCNKPPLTGELRTMEIYSITVPEARSLEQCAGKAVFLPEALRKVYSFLCQWLLVSLDLWTHPAISACTATLLPLHSVSNFPYPFSHKDIGH